MTEGRIEADAAGRQLPHRSAGAATGPVAIVQLQSWRALVRLIASGSVGWYKAWAQGEWTSPDPVPLFELFMRNAPIARRHRRGRRGRGGWSTGSPIACAPTTASGRGATSPIITISATISTPPGSIPAMTYSSAVFADPRAGRAAGGGAGAQDPAAARPARPEAGPAPARDRLRLGRARRDRGARLWRPGHRPHPVRGAEGLCRGQARSGRAGRARSTSRSPTIATSPARSMRSPASRWWRRSGRNIGRPISQAIARALKPGGRAALQLISIRDELCSNLCRQCRLHPDLHLPRRHADRRGRVPRRSAEAAGLDWRDRVGYGAHYAETLRHWRRTL